MFQVIDFYNAYKRTSHECKTVIRTFFSYTRVLSLHFCLPNTVLVFDGKNYFKRNIDPSYKSDRNIPREDEEIVEEIKKIALCLPNFFIIEENTLEADDLSYCFCKDHDNCICVSEDYDWLYNLTANENVGIYRNQSIITKHNIELVEGYPLSKIKLYLFLKGDSKDNVKKPFRLKTELKEEVNQYNNIEEYLNKNKMSVEQVKKYIKLIFPIEDIKYLTSVGKINEHTMSYIKKYELDFFRPLLVNEGSLI